MRTITLLSFVLFISALSSQDTIVNQESFVQFQFKLSLKSLEETVNESIPEIIYIDSSYKDNNEDYFKCTVRKSGRISIESVKNNVLKVDVPLYIWAKKGIGNFGLYTYRSTKFKMVMSFHLVYNVSKGWKLKTKTIANGYQWIQKPNLQIASIKIPITSVIEQLLDSKQQEYASLIDEQIASNIDLKENLIQLWNAMKQPQLVSEEYKTWFILTPQNIEATPFKQNKTHILSKFKINLISESIISSDTPIASPDVYDIPNLRYLPNLDGHFELFTTISIPFTEATEIAKKKFIDQEFKFKEDKYSIKVNDIHLYESNSNLMLEVDVEGSFNGKLFIEGKPTYVEEVQSIKLKDLSLTMKTKNILHKMANWLFNKKIENSLEENFAIPTGELFNYSKTAINESINQKRNGIQFQGSIDSLVPTNVYIADSSMNVVVLTKGIMDIEF